MTDAFVTCRELHLAFGPDAPALQGVDLQLGDGLVGLVGANGAGKTTLLQLLAGLLTPSAGTVRIRGLDGPRYRESVGIGFVPDAAVLPPYLPVHEFLEGLRVAAGSPPPTAAEQALAAEFGLDELGTRRLSALSLGQRRRVELLAALIGDPDLVLLDEPTNGLDPLAMTALRSGLLAARRPGRLILVSSHHLDELQRIASWIVLLHRGRVAASEAAATMLAQGDSLEARFLATAGGHDA